MKEVKSTLSNFIRLTIAKLKGDDSEVIGLKNQKFAKVIFEAEMKTLEIEIQKLENRLESAKDEIVNALINNGELIKDELDYLNRWTEAVNNKNSILDDLSDKKDHLEELKKALDDIVN